MIRDREIVVVPGDRGPVVTSKAVVRWLAASGPPPPSKLPDDPFDEVARIAIDAIGGPITLHARDADGNLVTHVRMPETGDRVLDELVAYASVPVDHEIVEKKAPTKRTRREPPRQRSRPGPPERGEAELGRVARFEALALGGQP
jgi:hypothetical protein